MHLGSARARGAVAAATLLAACASSSLPPPGASDHAGVQRVILAASRLNAGEIAYVVLIGRDHQTDVVFKVSGAPGRVTRPVHLYTYLHQGSCTSPSEQPAYALADRVLTRRDGDGFLTLNSTVPLDISMLRESPYALVVRSSPADANQVLFCGELRPG